MHMKRMLRALSVGAFFLVAAARAQADDDGTQLGAKLQSAEAGVTSFQATMHGFSGMTVSMVVVRPDRVKFVSSFGPVSSEAVVVGANTYMRVNGGPWTTSTTAGTVEAAKYLVDSLCTCATYTMLPDRRENGDTVGAFSASVPLPGLPDARATAGAPAAPAAGASATTKPSTMDCTYDKTTYLLRSCTVQLANIPSPLTMTYAKWNDPGNVVDVPADVPAPPHAAPVAPTRAAAASK